MGRGSFDQFVAGVIILQIVAVAAVIGGIIFAIIWGVGEYEDWKDHLMQPTPAAEQVIK